MLQFGRHDDSWLKRLGDKATRLAYIYGPTGWHDANTAFYVERYLALLGPKGERAWLERTQRYQTVQKHLKDEYQHVEWNMRRKIGSMALLNIGNVSDAAAETLFHRRCLILACELEKHRLRHGAYPASPDAVRETLKPFTIVDPAKPTQLPGYRLEKDGYVLSSVRDKGWDWRMRRAH